MKWYQEAAKRGERFSIMRIGYLYSRGGGVDQDYSKAMTFYRAAAAKGDEVAMNNIGSMYYNGEGVVKDEKLAKYWFNKAIANGNEHAKDNLAIMEANDSFHDSRDHSTGCDNNCKAERMMRANNDRYYREEQARDYPSQ